MALGNLYEDGGEPRSVPDSDRDSYEAMIRDQAALNAQREAAWTASRTQPASSKESIADGGFEFGGHKGARTTTSGQPDPEHSLPDAITAGLANAFGFARRARAEWERGHPISATKDAVIGLPDAYFDGALLGGLLKRGGFKYVGPHVWRTAPWKDPGARKWMGEAGFLNPKESAHHWLIPQNAWGKAVPDFIKNQPWNIKGGLDAVTHGRIHGRYKIDGVQLPQFNALQRLWFGTPAYAKALFAASVIDERPTRQASGEGLPYEAAQPEW